VSQPLRLLVLEDSASDAELLVHELQSSGYACEWQRVDDRESFAAALGPHLDLVLADYTLPSYTALDALHHLKTRELDVPVIVVTGATGEDKAVECLRLGAVDYLLKDRLARLPDAIGRALEERSARAATREAQRTLEESERRFRRLVEGARDVIFRYRLKEPRGFEYVSPAIAAVTGHSPDDFYRDPHLSLSLVHPDDRALLEQVLAARQPSIAPTGVRWLRTDGTRAWTEIIASAIHDANGDVEASEGIARDVTERRRSERDVHLAAQVLEHVPSLVVVADQAGAITYCSPSVERVLGFQRGDLLGDGWWRLTRLTLKEGEEERLRLRREAAAPAVSSAAYERMLVDVFGRSRWFEWRDERGPRNTIVGVGHEITVRKYAEEERRALIRSLEKSEAKYRALVEQMPAMAYTIDLEGNTVYVSPQVERFVGRTPDEVAACAEGWWGQIHPDDRAIARARAETLRLGSPSDVLQYRVRHNDGRILWVRDEATLLSDHAGKPLSLHGIVVDVTERVLAEQAVRDSAHALRTLIDASPLAIIEIDLNRRVTMWNRAAEQMFGWTAGDILGRPNPLLSNEDAEDVDDFRQLSSGTSIVKETQRRRQDGTLLDVMISAAPIMDSRGRITSVLGVVKDVTDRRRAQAALQEREEHFRSLIENATDLIVVVDAAGRVTYVSPSIATILGRRAAVVTGTSVFDWVHPDDASTARAAFREAMGQPQRPVSLVVRVRRDDGEWRTMEAVAKGASRAGAQSLIVNARDITERTRLEEQLRQAQKMQAIGQLAGGVAHDFNNLLTAILGYGNLLRERLSDGSSFAEDLDEIVRAGERAAGLTRQLLAFSRKQSLTPQRIALPRLITDFEKMLRRVIGEDVRLAVALDADLPPVFADPGQLEQVLLNLAVNARDAMPHGGNLTIEASATVLDEPTVFQQARLEAGRWVRLVVRDTGVGIAPDVLPRIFEPFFTTKPPGQGTGLGLATVYGIVSQSQGQIAVDSVQGAGTTFTVFLPAVQQTAAQSPDPRGSSAPGRGTETILLAEDEAAIRRLICTTLEREGYTVLAAENGDEAVHLVARHHGRIDLLVSDLIMPGMSGADLASSLVAQYPSLKVMHITGYAASAEVQKLNPGVPLLNKPFTPRELVARVRQCLDAHPAGSPASASPSA